jgi:hypothetical protein
MTRRAGTHGIEDRRCFSTPWAQAVRCRPGGPIIDRRNWRQGRWDRVITIRASPVPGASFCPKRRNLLLYQMGHVRPGGFAMRKWGNPLS